MESEEINNEPSIPVENSMASSVEPTTSSSTSTMDVESTASASTLSSDTNAVLENENPTPQTSNETMKVAESPAAKGRSAKQQEADEGAAEMLERMRNLYSKEFADIPEKKRPKPPAWAARAAMYKNGQEREDYIENLIRNSRNSLMAKNSSGSNTNMGNNTGALVEQLMNALETATKVARQLKNTTRKGKSGRSSVMTNNSGMNALGNSEPSNSEPSNSRMNNSEPSNSGLNSLSNSGPNNSEPSNSRMSNSEPSNSEPSNSGLNNSGMNNGNSTLFNNKKTAKNFNNNSMRTRRVKPLSNNRATTNSKKSRSKLNEPSLNF